MATGMLLVSGSIDLNQFWPIGGSDADTTKVLVTVDQNGFQFRPNGSAAYTPTHVFDGAKVKGDRGSVRDVKDSKGRITVRLQGIDAAELHYRPTSTLSDPPKAPKPGVKYRTAAQKKLFLQYNEEYRQPTAETATVALHTYLTSFGQNPLPCKVVSAVDEPNQVFDTYGRLVGDILIGPNDINVNHWLVQNGWATPAFYSSMGNDEITAITALATSAYNDNLGIWPQYQSQIPAFDWGLLYRRPKKNTPINFDPALDLGNVIFPKLFRRLTAWAVNRKAKMVSNGFKSYLAAQKADRVMLTSEYLLQGVEAAYEYPLADFLINSYFAVWPEDLVIKEKPSTLIPAPGHDLKW